MYIIHTYTNHKSLSCLWLGNAQTMNGILVYWFVWRPFHTHSMLAPILPGLFQSQPRWLGQSNPSLASLQSQRYQQQFPSSHYQICKLPLNIILKVLFTSQGKWGVSPFLIALSLSQPTPKIRASDGLSLVMELVR